jgi:K+-transporting ATPase KdpF subunit
MLRRASAWSDEEKCDEAAKDLSSLFAALSAASAVKRGPRNLDMTIDYVIGLVVTAALLVYLTYALLRPEKF